MSAEDHDDLCKWCGGLKAIRNPMGNCDHLYWPAMLTDEAKRANGFRRVQIVETKWIVDPANGNLCRATYDPQE